MANITASLVGELRKLTGAGMMECKKALEASNGDIDVAIDNMRKQGQAKAVKKADRTAAEGIIIIKATADNKRAVIMEVNCETDFVARDENFKHFAEAVATRALNEKVSDIAKLMALTMGDDKSETIEQTRQNLVAKIGENIQARRITLVESNDLIASYLHSGRIGVLVNLAKGDMELGKDLAMHVAASNPSVVSPTDVSADLINKEKEIFTAQALASGKPQAIVDKMVDGRIKKFLEEVSLLGQPFVKDPEITVADLLKKTNGQVQSFVRFEVGEGIEKKADNFVEEVMAQVRGS